MLTATKIITSNSGIAIFHCWICLCWSHIPHCWKSHVAAHFLKSRLKKVNIRNQYNQAQRLTQDTNEKVTTSQLDVTIESQDISPFPAGDHNAQINRRAQRHNNHKTEINTDIKLYKRSTALEWSVEIFYWGLKAVSQRQPHA